MQVNDLISSCKIRSLTCKGINKSRKLNQILKLKQLYSSYLYFRSFSVPTLDKNSNYVIYIYIYIYIYIKEKTFINTPGTNDSMFQNSETFFLSFTPVKRNINKCSTAQFLKMSVTKSKSATVRCHRGCGQTAYKTSLIAILKT